ncbi:MAG: hypothetical protein K0S32_1574 [Bacteroidetes bacterium]|jgi:hypothetical protein|nr:hypothetical protein [Bacteroidota bacterium]
MIFHILVLLPVRPTVVDFLMIDELRDVFFKYSPWSVVLPVLLLFKQIRHKDQRELKPLFYYFILSLITQALSLIFWFYSINNLPLLHIYTPLEFLLLLWFYSILLEKQFTRTARFVVTISFLLFSIIDSWFLEDIYTFNTLGRSIEALVIILLSITWFLFSIREDRHVNKNINYIIAGIFIYFSGSIVLFSFSNIITRFTHSLALNVWSIHTLLLVSFYTLVTIALLKWKTN